MDFTSNSSFSTLQTVKERIREKINGSWKTVKLQTSLATKIKTKTLNNSSFLKVSLKQNNKALACALTAERQKTRKLESDKMFLQKEVKMLHFQNALLRQNLSIVNTMLKDIDLFMNVNLPAAIEISSTMEPSNILSSDERKSERFSHQSSLDENQGFRLTGVALRVPASSVDNSIPTVVVEDHHRIVSPSANSSIEAEKSDRQAETVLHAINFTSKESLSTSNESTSQDNVSNLKVNDSVFLLDEVLSSSSGKAQSDRFVTTRRKRSTVSRSSTQSVKSDTSQNRRTTSASRESCHSTQRDMDTHATVLPDSGHTGFCSEIDSHFDFVTERARPSMLPCSISQFEKSETPQNCASKKESYNFTPVEQVAVTTNQPVCVHFGESDQHPVVDSCVEPEKTVYEADMEITSSDSAAIIAVVSNNKTQPLKSRSNIPIKQDGTTLRKVRQSVREKTKKKGILCDKKISNSSESKEMTETVVESNKNVTTEVELSADLIPSLLSDKYDYRRTYVLPGPVKQDKIDVLESTTNLDPVSEIAKSTESAEQLLSNTITALHSERSELTFTLENKHCTEIDHNTTDTEPVEKKKPKIRKRASKNMESSRKKKQKVNAHSRALEEVGEGKVNNINESFEQLGNSQKVNAVLNCSIKNQEPQIRRETYVVCSAEPHPMTTELISEYNQFNYRRETFVIPKPNLLVSNPNKALNSEEKTLVPIELCPKTENGFNLKKTESKNGHLNHVSDPDFDRLCDYRMESIFKFPAKKGSSSLSSCLDTKTLILPAIEDYVGPDKGTLVRESSVNLTSSQTRKPTKILNAILTNKRESFMLDMVSESILDETLESPSFVEFPSTTNPESTFTVNMSLNTIQPLELPVPENCNNRDLSHASKSLNVMDINDNGKAKDPPETKSNTQSKSENQSMESQDPAIKPFQDLTNKVFGSTKQSPKSCSEEDDDSKANCRRRRNPVNYKEPSLAKKLRR
ncbi:shugoshin 2 [Mixophyes fleayi]|uniref:shugoshin 2 n=1 Tax=Mixophyes fleayi TaxID=3061075 RepID=UPI003F4DFF87